jgi:DNA-binding transcriptional regulator YiaG
MKKPQFDADGYQIDLDELNGEPLPDLSKVKVVQRAAAKVPPTADARKALAGLKARQDKASLAVAREKLGFTQERFAEALGVKVGTYRQWEHGRRALTGPARALVRLVSRHPELVLELTPAR